MHELSIARSIVEIAAQAVRNAGAEKTITVHVRIGALSAIAPVALEFSYDVAARDTALANSRLVVELVPATVSCPICKVDTELTTPTIFECGICGTPTGDVRSGRELEVVSVEVV